MLVDARGVPLSLVASGASVHDGKLLPATLDGTAVERPETDPEVAEQHPQPVQHLCADAGYKGEAALRAVEARGCQPHIRQRRQEAEAKRSHPGWKARRWVVERTHSWLNRFRKLLVSFEKTEASYIALLWLAAALTCWRQTLSIYG